MRNVRLILPWIFAHNHIMYSSLARSNIQILVELTFSHSLDKGERDGNDKGGRGGGGGYEENK